MKKINFILASLLIASVAFFSSCSKDTSGPSITLNSGTGYTNSDVTVDVGTVLTFSVSAQSGSAKLTNFKINATTSINYTLVDTTLSSVDTYADVYSFEFASIGVTKLTFVITDADGNTAEQSLTVTTQGAINQFTAVLLGGQLNPTYGSFYSTADNSVMNLATARTNSQKVDMVYYYGTTNQASIVATSDAQLLDVPVFAECNSWTTKNATIFKLTSGIDWSTITTYDAIESAATGMTDTHVNQLAVGDIVAFQTAVTSSNPSRKGLYKVLEVNGTTGADRSIKIEVRIQK